MEAEIETNSSNEGIDCRNLKFKGEIENGVIVGGTSL